MRKVVDLLGRLRAQGVSVAVEGESLKCSAPPGVLTAELRAELTQLKPEILAFLRSSRKTAGGGEAILSRVDRTGVLPLSYAQQRLWFLCQLDPESTVNNIPTAVSLTGKLDIDALERAIREIIRRHENLRTCFMQENGIPRVVIRDEVPWSLQRMDARYLAAESPTELIRYVSRLSLEAMDITRAPLLRGHLLTTAAETYVLLLTVHHIVFDGWSMGVFVRELEKLYRAYASGTTANLPPLALQYVDYAVWQRQWLESGVLERQLAYLKKQLAGAPPVVTFPADRRRPQVEMFRGARRKLVIPAALVQGLELLSQHHGVTLFMTLLACFDVLLARYTGQEEIVVGSPSAGRNRSELSDLMGFFVSNLVLRTDVSDNPVFSTLLTRVRDVSLQAYEHQDVPFDQLVQALRPERSPDHSPLFQTMFILQNFPIEPIEMPGVSMQRIELEVTTARFDLTVEAFPHEGELDLYFDYNADLYEAPTIGRLQAHYQSILEAAVKDPSQTIGEIPLLSPAEREKLLFAWNQTQARIPPDLCFHHRFEEIARHSPDRVALLVNDDGITYGELNQRADQIAAALRGRGAGPDQLVGVFLPRGSDLVAALLGVAKSGAAYVPLDPVYPRGRIENILEDARPVAVITSTELLDRLPATAEETLCLDQEADLAAPDGAPVALSSAPGQQHLAYVIFTSGSTGRPKGVQIGHRALVNFLEAMREEPGLTEKDVLLAVTTVSFDIAGLELLLPLYTGATVCMALQPGDPMSLLRDLDRYRPTVMQATPTTWKLLVAAGWQGDPRLKILCGGEALEPGLAEALIVRSDQLWNMYGPTETTIWSAAYPVRQPGAEAIPVGRPIRNTGFYVLDRTGQPVPQGVVGELWIGGAGLARGYLNRPDLTAERFVLCPWAQNGEARMYRTGDLVRYRSDGTLDFYGRADHQVKLRGFRIELGEIDNAVRQFEGVTDAVTVLREDDGEKRLVAYVEHAGAAPSPAGLRDRLRESLPEYMIPASFVFLARLPRLPNGKLDRSSLPKPEMARREGDSFATPAPGMQQIVAHVFREALQLDRVGADENFFDLGAHSLQMVRIHAVLNQRLEKPIPLVSLFQYPNVRALSSFRKWTGIDAMNRNREMTGAALIGMAGTFPGAGTVREFWRNLVKGLESIRFASREELVAAGVDPALVAHPDYVPAISQVKAPEYFDAAFFGFSAREAEIIDPQQRVFLECAWSALEDAACDPATFPGAIGIFAGAGMNTYAAINLLSHPDLIASVGPYQVMIGNDKDFLCSRVAYKLNLRGPAVGVQTACSTSLVAVQMAFESLLRGECDMALAGGVSIPVPQHLGYLYTPGMILSRDGHCRSFDAAASGTVPAGGAGLVVLKRLDAAVADGDHIYAVLRGAAVNNDGAAKVGYSAPSVEGQESVIRKSMEMAGFDPATVRYVETHGTGTEVGDPIEFTALAQAFASVSNGTHRCALGALKTNLGHLDAAAGVAGLMKAALALRHRTLPPTLHFRRSNPLIELEKTPFYINTAVETYEGAEPFRAGVSSFGIGGTNAHVSLEEPPAADSDPSRGSELLVLSAKTPGALEARIAQLLDFLEETPGLDMADVAFTLGVGRQPFRCRQALVTRTLPHLRETLRSGASAPEIRKLRNDDVPADPSSVAFLFPGQGAQFVHMGRDLYQTEPLFRETVDRCSAALQPAIEMDLRTVLYPQAGGEAEAEGLLRQTSITQPALFTIEYAMAQLWMQCGIRPSAMIGHSIGEYVAACLAGVFSLEDALALVAERGRLIQSLPPGVMLAVSLSEFNLTPLLPTGVSIAAVNAENQTVASGAEEEIAQLEAVLQKKGVRSTRLRSSHAFHSPMVDPVVGSFVEQVARIRRKAPSLLWLSNVSGTWISAEEAIDPAYWGAHLRRTVRFADCARVLLRDTEVLLLEVGPGETLSSLVRAQSGSKRPVISSMRHAMATENDRDHWLAALGQLWVRNAPASWKGVYAGQRRLRVSLPTYPFERQRYYVEPAKTVPVAAESSAPERKPDLADWFYVPSWKRTAPALAQTDDSVTLVFADHSADAAGVISGLRAGGRVVEVRSGETFRSAGADGWEIKIDRPEEYQSLIEELQAHELWPRRIVYLSSPGAAEASLASGMFLVQALADSGRNDPIAFTIVLDRAYSVVGEEVSSPEGSALAAFWRVVPLECPNLTVRLVDVDAAQPHAIGEVIGQVRRAAANETVACRDRTQWQQIYEPVRIEEHQVALSGGLSLRSGGTYLITGGTGGIGTVLARHIAERTRGLLILTGRTPVPPQEQWPGLLASPDTALRTRIEALQSVCDAGGRVRILQADAGDTAAMRQLMEELRQQYGAVHGVIHAAGIAGGRIIRANTPEDARAVLAPKVHATEWLGECLGSPELDFVLLCSSISAVVPSVGQSDYGAANAWMDGFAAVHDDPAGTRVIAVNWDTWREVGMAVNTKVPAALEAVRKQVLQHAIRPQEATIVFDRVLAFPIPQMVVSTRDLERLRLAAMNPATAPPTAVRQADARPITRSDGQQLPEGAEDEVEAAVMQVWQELLGVPVGPQDNFFELGGHSLVGIQVLSQVRERFGVNLSLHTIFEAATPSELAERIRLMRWALNPVEDGATTVRREEMEF